MTERTEQLPAITSAALPANPAGPNIAAAWYVAMPSARLRRRPQALELFGRQLVAWRDGGRRPVVMTRWCPHQGASLALGRVAGGTLQCPFHHWRFDGTGSCVAVPGLQRIPSTARVRSYPTVERYGLIWVWYGTPEPLYDVPDFPPLARDRGRYAGFRYADRTAGTIRHLLENAVDHYHFRTLHGLTMHDLSFTVLDDPDEAAINGAPIGPRSAWFGVRVQARLPRPPILRHPYIWLTSVVSTFGVGEGFDLLVDGWPGGQRFTFSVDGEEIYAVLMGVTPTGDRDTTQIGWAGVRRTGRPVRTAVRLALFWVQNRAGTRQDVPIYDTTVTDDAAVYVRYDNGVMRFRRWYQDWVERARATEGTEGVENGEEERA